MVMPHSMSVRQAFAELDGDTQVNVVVSYMHAEIARIKRAKEKTDIVLGKVWLSQVRSSPLYIALGKPERDKIDVKVRDAKAHLTPA